MKNQNHNKNLIDHFINILMLFQIIAGIIWIFLCGFKYSALAGSNELYSSYDIVMSGTVVESGRDMINAAFSGNCDEYTGFLYPAFLKLFISLFAKGYFCSFVNIIYVIQFFTLFFSAYFMVSSNLNFVSCDRPQVINKDIVIYSLYIVTFPFLLQSAFMISYISFLMSGFMIFIGLIKRSSFEENAKRKVLKPAIFILILVILFIFNISNRTAGLNNKLPFSPATGLMNNFAINHFESDYYFWSEELQEAIDYSNISYLSKDNELVIMTFPSYIQGDIDIRKATYQIAFASIKNRIKDSIKTFANNYLDYLIAPLTFLDNCEGYGKSVTGERLLTLEGKYPLYAMIFAKFGIAVYLLVFSKLLADGIINLYRNKRMSRNGLIVIMIMFTCPLIYSLFSITYFDYMFYLPVFIIVSNQKKPL